MASNLKKENLRSQYKVLFYLGKGYFGTVNLASHLKTDALVAIKSVEITKKNINLLMSERATLETLNHPNIVRLFQVLRTSSHIHFVMEYMPGGSLLELVEKNGPLQEEVAKTTFGQIVAAIKYCHNIGIIHRDLTPQNVLIDAEGNAKLTDFGLAMKYPPGSLLKQKCGTKGFQSPEMVLEEPYDGKKTDVWSLGVLLYFVTTAYYPFTGHTIREIENKITMGTYKIPRYFSAHLENLIHQLLSVSPEMRPSVEDIETHPWVRKCDINIPTDKDPDTTIIHMLCGMGFHPYDILESLRKNKFDQNMGTYLLLKEQIRKGIKHTSTTSPNPVDPCPPPAKPEDPCPSPAKPMDPCPPPAKPMDPCPPPAKPMDPCPLPAKPMVPCPPPAKPMDPCPPPAKPVIPCPPPSPSPAQTSNLGLPIKRRASEPNFGLLHIWPSGGQRPVALTPSGHTLAKSVSMPPIPLHCPPKKSGASSHALPSGAVAAPGVFSTIWEDEICLPPEEDLPVETTSIPVKIGCFRKMGRRIRHCLAKLCCFPRAPTTNNQQHLSLKKVAPLEEARCSTQ